jgi:hypothetical protein
MQSATADGEHILLVDATCLSAAASGIYRQVQLAPGTWRVQQGTVSVAPELLPSSDALKQGLLLLNKTIRVWLGGARAKPTVAPVVVSAAVMSPWVRAAAAAMSHGVRDQHSTPQRSSMGRNSQCLRTADVLGLNHFCRISQLASTAATCWKQRTVPLHNKLNRHSNVLCQN